MDAFLLQILNGLDKGSAYALIALGLTLIFGTLGVVNFAHGALFMLGAFCAVTLQRILTLSYSVVDETQKDFLGNPPRSSRHPMSRAGSAQRRDRRSSTGRCRWRSCSPSRS